MTQQVIIYDACICLFKKEMIYNLINRKNAKLNKASEVLSYYLRQRNYPHWTAYFVKYKDVVNDQFFQSCFIHHVDKREYLIMRTGCFPFIKYHCSKMDKNEYDPAHIRLQNKFFNIIKVANFGIYIEIHDIDSGMNFISS